MPVSETSLRLTEVYRDRLAGLTRAVEDQARGLWTERIDFADLDRSYEPVQARVGTLVERAQRQAVQLTAAYITAFVSSEQGKPTTVRRVNSSRYVGRSFGDKPLADSLRSPLFSTLAAIKRGDPDPLGQGQRVLLTNVDLDVKAAARSALADAIKEDDRIVGWQRAVSGTCGACSGSLPRGDSMPVHPHCQCVQEPVSRPASNTAAAEDIRGQVERWGQKDWTAEQFAEMEANWVRNLEKAISTKPEVRQAVERAIKLNERSPDFQGLIDRWAGGRDVVVTLDKEAVSEHALLRFNDFEAARRLADTTFLNDAAQVMGVETEQLAGILRHEFSHSLWDAVPSATREDFQRLLQAVPHQETPFSDVPFFWEFTKYANATRQPAEAWCEAARVAYDPAFNPADWSPEFQKLVKWMKEALR